MSDQAILQRLVQIAEGLDECALRVLVAVVDLGGGIGFDYMEQLNGKIDDAQREQAGLREELAAIKRTIKRAKQ